MTALEQAERLLAQMTRSEKAQLLPWVVRDLGDAFPSVESTPGVCGGEPCIVRTRIPVWVLEQARRLGTFDRDFSALAGRIDKEATSRETLTGELIRVNRPN